jgi:hypothetical protein
MPLYLILQGSAFYRQPKILDLDQRPSLTITANGVGAIARHQYWIVEAENTQEVLHWLRATPNHERNHP